MTRWRPRPREHRQKPCTNCGGRGVVTIGFMQQVPCDSYHGSVNVRAEGTDEDAIREAAEHLHNRYRDKP